MQLEFFAEQNSVAGARQGGGGRCEEGEGGVQARGGGGGVCGSGGVPTCGGGREEQEARGRAGARSAWSFRAVPTHRLQPGRQVSAELSSFISWVVVLVQVVKFLFPIIMFKVQLVSKDLLWVLSIGFQDKTLL